MGKDKFIRILLITIGIILSIIGINGFLAPANLLSNGFAGIAVLVDYMYNINMGVFIFVINIPIFLYSRKYVDKEFFYSSLINMIIYSVALGATQDFFTFININDIMMQSIFGGVFVGIGLGLIFKANASLGGMDIVTAILKIRYDISIGSTFLVINTLIVCAGGMIFGVRLAMYTIVSMYITSVTLEGAKNCFNKQKSILLISDRYEEIAEAIMTKMHRGVTFLEAEGAYTNNKKKLIYCIVSSNQVIKVKELIYETDENAFVSINNVDEVRGGGFKAKAL